MRNRAGLVRVLVRRKDGVEQHYWVRPDEVNAFVNKQKAKGNAVIGVEGVGQAGQKSQFPISALALQTNPKDTQQDDDSKEVLERWNEIKAVLQDIHESLKKGRWDLFEKGVDAIVEPLFDFGNWLKNKIPSLPITVRKKLLSDVRKWARFVANNLLEGDIWLARNVKYKNVWHALVNLYEMLDEDSALEDIINLNEKVFEKLDQSGESLSDYRTFALSRLVFAFLDLSNDSDKKIRIVELFRKWYDPKQGSRRLFDKKIHAIYRCFSHCLSDEQCMDSKVGEMVLDFMLELLNEALPEQFTNNDSFDLCRAIISMFIETKAKKAIYPIFEIALKGQIYTSLLPTWYYGIETPVDVLREIASAHPDYDWRRELALVDKLIRTKDREGLERAIELLAHLAVSDGALYAKVLKHLSAHDKRLAMQFGAKVSQLSHEWVKQREAEDRE